jgi:hypothetical protein
MFEKNPLLDLFAILTLVILTACSASTPSSPAATQQPTTAAVSPTKPMDTLSSPTTTQQPTTAAVTPTRLTDTPAPTPTTCTPGYAEPIIIHEYGPGTHPADFAATDFNGDYLADFIVARGCFSCYDEFPEYFFANDGNGGVFNATDAAFEGPVTVSQTPREVVTADFNNDGIMDLFIADTGSEAEGPPFPGFQNSLIL